MASRLFDFEALLHQEMQDQRRETLSANASDRLQASLKAMGRGYFPVCLTYPGADGAGGGGAVLKRGFRFGQFNSSPTFAVHVLTEEFNLLESKSKGPPVARCCCCQWRGRRLRLARRGSRFEQLPSSLTCQYFALNHCACRPPTLRCQYFALNHSVLQV